MSQSNLFAFTGVNFPQLSSSKASLHAEISKLKRENVMLQREAREANDANGEAHTLAAAKNQAQEAQRATKRAELAERVARKALDAVCNTRKMSSYPIPGPDKSEKLKKEVDETNKTIGKLQVEPKTSKGSPDNAPNSLGDTNMSHDDCKRTLQQLRDESEKDFRIASEEARRIAKRLEQELQDVSEQLQQRKKEAVKTGKELQRVRERNENLEHDLQSHQKSLNELNVEFETCVHADLENANKKYAEQQAQLQDAKARLSTARTENQELNYELDEVKTELETVHNDRDKLEDKFKHQTDVNTHLSDINNNLRADLVTQENTIQTLRFERNDFKHRLEDALLALESKEKSETEVRGTMAVLEAEAEDIAQDLSKQNDSLLDEINTLTQRVSEHKQDVFLRDERIAFLQRENEVLKNDVLEYKLEEEQTHKTVNRSIDRPITYRKVSTVSNRSMYDEFDGLFDFDDDQSNYTHSEVEESVVDSINLELSAVRDIITIAPQDIAAPRLTVSVSDAIATTPRRQDSFTDCSPVSSVSSIEPTQPAASRLSIYNDTVAVYVPSEPAAPTLSMFEETVESLSPIEPRWALLSLSAINAPMNYAPAELTNLLSEPSASPLSISEYTVEVISPSEPRGASLVLSNVRTDLEYAPVEPMALASIAIAQPGKSSPYIGKTLHYLTVKPATPEAQTLTLNISKHAVISLNPDSGKTSVTDHHAHQVKLNEKNQKLTCKGTKPEDRNSERFDSLWEKPSPPCPSVNHSERKYSDANSEIVASRLQIRSPIDAFAGLPEPSGTVDLDKVSRAWPLEDEPIYGEIASQLSTPIPNSPPASTKFTPSTPVSSTPVYTSSTASNISGVDLLVHEEQFSTECILSRLLVFILGLQVVPQRMEPTSTRVGYVVIKIGRNSFVNFLVHLLLAFVIAFLAWRWWDVRSKLWAWEHANGVGFGEGYGNTYDHYGPYGNGNGLLGMLPHNLLSADSLLPAKAVEVITSTVRAFEGFIGFGLGPTVLY